MKNAINLMILGGAILFSACSSNGVETSDAKKKADATKESITYKVDPKQSELNWSGKKLASGHSGLIEIKSGEISAEGDKITAGKFEVDMKTITEPGNPDQEKAAYLTGHLMSEDFFDAEKYPVTSFEITGVDEKDGKFTISGNLTIKGISKNISFPAKVKADGEKLTADAEFTINRNDWGVTYGSGITGAAADQAIHDDIEFKISLVALK
jgi:polyisoprenoid-binding protein YceI